MRSRLRVTTTFESQVWPRPQSSATTGPLFLSSATVVIVEAVKLPVCLCAAAYQLRRHNGLVELLRRELLFNPVDTLKCAVPALCYTIQGNLLYTAVQHLEAPTFQVRWVRLVAADRTVGGRAGGRVWRGTWKGVGRGGWNWMRVAPL